jgi:hypothetical protein
LADFSQHHVLEFQVLDLNRVVDRALQEFLPAAKGKLECEYHYCASLPRISADGGMLGQAISHLLANALDAMPQGGRLTLTTDSRSHLVEGREEFVCLTVRDTGRGIPPAILSRMFEPFFTTKDAGDRSGLGLALVYGIVKQHHGWIEVGSQVGQGTTFKIFLPAAPKRVVFVGSDPLGPLQRRTRRLPEPESAALATVARKPSAVRAVFFVSEDQTEPFLHWGINE